MPKARTWRSSSAGQIFITIDCQVSQPDLVKHRVAVIAAVGGIHSGLAAKAASSTIPIVVVSAGDPVAFGLVPSLSRHGTNVTGVSMITVALAPMLGRADQVIE